MPVTPEHTADEARALDLLMPIQFFYLRENRTLPEVEFINGEDMPEPYRGLLVHKTDMTPRLRAFHESEISLHVLDNEVSEDYLIRAVALKNNEGKPIEIGAIGIRLEVFDEPLRTEIVEGSGPLGGLLELHQFPHSSNPKAYFKVKADRWIASHCDCPEGTLLYGRCNALNGADGLTFADIVEVLPENG